MAKDKNMKTKGIIPKTDYVIEKTDVVVVFSEIDTRFIKDEFFAGIAALEADNFGSTYIKNPANPVFQLTLPQSRIIIQILGNRLIVTDSSAKLPTDTELIKRYFTSIYTQITTTVPCAVSAYGFNYSIFTQDNSDLIDTNLGLHQIKDVISKDVLDYSSNFSFQENDVKYTLIASTIGNKRKIQMNSHFDVTKDLLDMSKIQDTYVQNWKYFMDLFNKLRKEK